MAGRAGLSPGSTASRLTVNGRIRDIRQLLQAAGRTVEPAGARLADLDALHDRAASHGITVPAEIKTASY